MRSRLPPAHTYVCVCVVSTGPYMCAHKIFVWGAIRSTYLWHVCEFACVHMQVPVCTYAACCMCTPVVPPGTVALHMLLGGGGAADGRGLPAPRGACHPGFCELAIAPLCHPLGPPPNPVSLRLGCVQCLRTLPILSCSRTLLPRAVSHPREWGGVSGWAAALKGGGRSHEGSHDASHDLQGTGVSVGNAANDFRTRDGSAGGGEVEVEEKTGDGGLICRIQQAGRDHPVRRANSRTEAPPPQRRGPAQLGGEATPTSEVSPAHLGRTIPAHLGGAATPTSEVRPRPHGRSGHAHLRGEPPPTWEERPRLPLEERPCLPDVGVAHAAPRRVGDVLLFKKLVHCLGHHAHGIADVGRLVLAVDELQSDDA